MENTNAFESTSSFSCGAVSPTSVAVHQAIRELDAVAGSDDSAPTSARARLTAAARSICDVARREGLTIEQALVRVKDAWRATPGRQKPRLGGTDAALDQLVSACIREFYTGS